MKRSSIWELVLSENAKLNFVGERVKTFIWIMKVSHIPNSPE